MIKFKDAAEPHSTGFREITGLRDMRDQSKILAEHWCEHYPVRLSGILQTLGELNLRNRREQTVFKKARALAIEVTLENCLKAVNLQSVTDIEARQALVDLALYLVLLEETGGDSGGRDEGFYESSNGLGLYDLKEIISDKGYHSDLEKCFLQFTVGGRKYQSGREFNSIDDWLGGKVTAVKNYCYQTVKTPNYIQKIKKIDIAEFLFAEREKEIAAFDSMVRQRGDRSVRGKRWEASYIQKKIRAIPAISDALEKFEVARITLNDFR